MGNRVIDNGVEGKGAIVAIEQVMDGIQREFVDKWEPSPRDLEFLRATVEALRTGCGRWVAPIGFTFHKPAENKLRLERVDTTWAELLEVLITIKRAVKIGKMIGVDIQIENVAEVITIVP